MVKPDSNKETNISSSNNPEHQTKSGIFPILSTADSITLLHVSAGDKGDLIHATLRVHRLQERPVFRVVSYASASPTDIKNGSTCIFLGPHWLVLPVTPECREAIEHFRRPDKEVVVWVDTICTSHIIVSDICAAAREVCVYLGAPDESSNMALDMISLQRYEASETEKGSLRALFSRPYFHDIWSVREIVSASSAALYCGDRRVNWSLLTESRFRRLGILNHVPLWVTKVYQMRGKFNAAHLLDLLIATKTCAAPDPRDRIFALLPLIEDASGYGLVVDYQLSVEGVYVGVAAFLLQHHHALHIVQYGRGVLSTSRPDDPYHHLPSWVPNWATFPSNSTSTWVAPKPDDTALPSASQTLQDCISGLTDVEISQRTGSLTTAAVIIRWPWEGQRLIHTVGATVSIEYSRDFLGTTLGGETLALLPRCDGLLFLGGSNPAAITTGTYQITGSCSITLQPSQTTPSSPGPIDPIRSHELLPAFIRSSLPLSQEDWIKIVRAEDLFVRKLELGEPIDDTPVSELEAYTPTQLREGLEFYLTGNANANTDAQGHNVAICKRLQAWDRKINNNNNHLGTRLSSSTTTKFRSGLLKTRLTGRGIICMPSRDKTVDALRKMLKAWKVEAITLLQSNWESWFHEPQTLYRRESEQAIRKAETVWQVLKAIEYMVLWGSARMTEEDSQRLWYKPGAWDWKTMERFFGRRHGIDDQSWHQKFVLRGFLVQFLPCRGTVGRITIL